MRLPLWGRRDREDKLEEEIRGHLQMAVTDRVERGAAVGIYGVMAYSVAQRSTK